MNMHISSQAYPHLAAPGENSTLNRLWLTTGLLMLSLLAGCDRSPASKTTQVLARVNGDEITVYSVNRLLALQPPSTLPAAQLQKQAVSTLIDQQLLVQAALAAKLERSAEVIEADEMNHKQALIRAYLAPSFSKLAAPAEAAIVAYYNAHPELFAARKLYQFNQINIQASDGQQTTLLTRLRDSSDLNQFLDGLKAQQIGFVTRVTAKAAEDLPTALLPRLAAAKPGDALLVGRNEQGMAIISVLSSTAAPLSLNDARPAIQASLLEAARKRALQAAIKRNRDSARIEYIQAQPGQNVRF
jgi:EpsD family peptidyl-prolyl cis-trans isomerase